MAAAAAVAIAFRGAAIAPAATVLLLAAVAIAELVYELLAAGDEAEQDVAPIDLTEDA